MVEWEEILDPFGCGNIMLGIVITVVNNVVCRVEYEFFGRHSLWIFFSSPLPSPSPFYCLLWFGFYNNLSILDSPSNIYPTAGNDMIFKNKNKNHNGLYIDYISFFLFGLYLLFSIRFYLGCCWMLLATGFSDIASWHFAFRICIRWDYSDLIVWYISIPRLTTHFTLNSGIIEDILSFWLIYLYFLVLLLCHFYFYFLRQGLK